MTNQDGMVIEGKNNPIEQHEVKNEQYYKDTLSCDMMMCKGHKTGHQLRRQILKQSEHEKELFFYPSQNSKQTFGLRNEGVSTEEKQGVIRSHLFVAIITGVDQNPSYCMAYSDSEWDVASLHTFVWLRVFGENEQKTLNGKDDMFQS